MILVNGTEHEKQNYRAEVCLVREISAILHALVMVSLAPLSRQCALVVCERVNAQAHLQLLILNVWEAFVRGFRWICMGVSICCISE
jgi:uncharacterized membrane protein YhfC